jgi:hypothetical protein
VLDIAVGGFGFGRQALPAMAHSAAECFHRMPIKVFPGVGLERLLGQSQLRLVDGQVACGAAVDAVEIIHEQLLDAAGERAALGALKRLQELALVSRPLAVRILPKC